MDRFGKANGFIWETILAPSLKNIEINRHQDRRLIKSPVNQPFNTLSTDNIYIHI